MPFIVQPTDDQIEAAVRLLREGGVIAFPTETVYGLGADTFNPAALELIYQLKGRPFDNPLIAHVLDWEQARKLIDVKSQALGGSVPTSLASSLAEKFWPGPLTLVLPKSDRVPARATAGRPTIAVRSPLHPVARRLLEKFGGPISAPSANRSGHVSPTTAEHVRHDFAHVPGAEDVLILDGGQCEVGIESTVLDLSSSGRPRVLRPGAVTVEQLRAIIGEVESPDIVEQAASPGTRAQHYAPRTPAELIATQHMKTRLAQSRETMAVLTFDASRIPAPHRAIPMSSTPEEYARVLYSALREADALGCSRIIIESPPMNDPRWRAIQDRVNRATTGD